MPQEDTMSDTAAKLMQQADVARREHRLADAYRDLTEAVEVCRRTGGRQELLSALKKLGQIERDMGRGDAARSLYQEAVALCREEGDPLELAHAVRHLGDIHQHAGRGELAEPCYHEALALYRSHEQTRPLDLANAIRPLALLKHKGGEVEEAKRLWAEARDLYATCNVPAGVAECEVRLADLNR
jgi:tetratricopeptide (TPR) repeat protein